MASPTDSEEGAVRGSVYQQTLALTQYKATKTVLVFVALDTILDLALLWAAYELWTR